MVYSARLSPEELATADTTWSWVWWSVLVTSATIHSGYFLRTTRQRPATNAKGLHRRRVMARLAAPYIFQIAWRSVLISDYPGRVTFFDHPVNSAMVARLLAVVGEITFAAQVATAIRWVSQDIVDVGGPKLTTIKFHHVAQAFSVLLVLFSTLGQCCATNGTATSNQGPFFLEGALWACFFFLTTVLGAFLWIELRALTTYRSSSNSSSNSSTTLHVGSSLLFVQGLALASPGAFAYMAFQYCPMCLESYRADEAAGLAYLSFSEGFYDALTRRVPSRAWIMWQWHAAWMTLYFVLGGFTSCWLASAPPEVAAAGAKNDKKQD